MRSHQTPHYGVTGSVARFDLYAASSGGDCLPAVARAASSASPYFLPLMRTGWAMMPRAAHRSSVRVETPWRSAFLRQDSSRFARFFLARRAKSVLVVVVSVMSRLVHQCD